MSTPASPKVVVWRGRSPRRLDKTIAPHPKYAYLILVFFFLFAFTNCPSPFWPQVAQIKHPLATSRHASSSSGYRLCQCFDAWHRYRLCQCCDA